MAPLTAYPLNNQIISSINYQAPQNAAANQRKPDFIVVLDRSGSMRDSVRRIVTEILPSVFAKLSYDRVDTVHLLTFSDDDEYHLLQVQQLASLTSFDQGGTCMFPAVRRLREIFESLKANSVEALRILAISDGLISDQDKTEAAAAELTQFAKTLGISTNSQAVRWEQPSADTRALCSLLQLNNVRPAQMVDTKLATANEDIAEVWARLFMDDQLGSGTTLSSSDKVFLAHPWDEEPIDRVHLQNGANTVWMTQVPRDMKLNNAPVKVNEGGKLDYKKLYELMREKYNYVVSQMKVHKVVSTHHSIVIMQRIVTYFKRVEVEIPVPAGTRSFSRLLEDIANDRKVASMTPEELKAYLEPRDVSGEMKPSGSVSEPSSPPAGDSGNGAMFALTPEQLIDVLKNFGATSLMVLLLKQTEGSKTCCGCKCNCSCHFKN